MTNIKSAIRRFTLSHYETMKPLVIIEAVSEEHALERCKIVAPIIQMEELPIYAIDEHSFEQPTIPFFNDGYFILLEASTSTIH